MWQQGNPALHLSYEHLIAVAWSSNILMWPLLLINMCLSAGVWNKEQHSNLTLFYSTYALGKMRVLPQPFKIIMLWSFVAARDFWLYVKIRLLCPGRLSFTYCLEKRIRFLNFPHLFSIIHQSVPILRRRKQNKNKEKKIWRKWRETDT